MAYQSGQNVIVAVKQQGAKGTAATGASGKVLRIVPTSGLRLTRQQIESAEVRRDGVSSRARLGTRMVPPGQYEGELSVGSFDELIAAVLRSTWTAAASVTQATMTSITTTTSTIVAAAGSWLTQGVRKGDLVRLTDHSTAANNGKWLRVLDVTASTITVPPNSLTLNAVADNAFTLTVARTIINGAAPVESYWTVDEHYQDIDASFVFEDLKWNMLRISARPNQNVRITLGALGLDANLVTGASAPQLTGPTATVSMPLVMSDGTLRINGVDYADLTSFDLEYTLGGNVPEVMGPKGPDVFLRNARLRGSFAGIRQDGTWFTAHKNETVVDIFAHFKENAAEPTPFISCYVGNAIVGPADASLGNEGEMSESVEWYAGKDEVGGANASTLLKLSTSAA